MADGQTPVISHLPSSIRHLAALFQRPATQLLTARASRVKQVFHGAKAAGSELFTRRFEAPSRQDTRPVQMRDSSCGMTIHPGWNAAGAKHCARASARSG